jgi:hypothetical protein
MSSVAGSNAQPLASSETDRPLGNRWILAVLAAAVPVLWLPFTLLHPQSTDVLADVKTETWLSVHYAQLALAPLLALAMLSVVGPLAGVAATVGRVGVVVWVALFSAFDSIAGIATGVLVDGGFADAADYLFDHSLVGGGSVLGWTAQPMWIVVAVASAVALRTNAATVACWATMLASVLFATHAGWTAALGLLALAVALLIAVARPVKKTPLPANDLDG